MEAIVIIKTRNRSYDRIKIKNSLTAFTPICLKCLKIRKMVKLHLKQPLKYTVTKKMCIKQSKSADGLRKGHVNAPLPKTFQHIAGEDSYIFK